MVGCLHTPNALLSRKKYAMHTEQEDSRGSRSWWTLEKEKYLSAYRIEPLFLSGPAFGVVTILTELLRFQCFRNIYLRRISSKAIRFCLEG